MIPMQRLSGRTAIITGAARGIGLAIAQRFAAEGALVTLVDIEAQGVRASAQAIDNAAFEVADVSVAADVARVVEAVRARTGRIDILVNNAGITHACDFLELDEADFDRVLRVNLKSMFLCGQAVAKVMVAAGTTGAIINMSSVNAVLAIANQVPYTVSKGGVSQLTNVMALSLAAHGIRVNAIGPGTIATEMAREAVLRDEASKNRILSRTPMRRLGEPHEIAAVAAFLASDDASYLTGQTIYADGGRLGLNYTVAVG